MDQNNVNEFLRLLKRSIEHKTLAAIRLYNKRDKAASLKQVLGRPVLIKDQYNLSLTLRTDTQDTTKNTEASGVIDTVHKYLSSQFYNAEFTTDKYQYFLTIYPNGRTKFRHKTAAETKEVTLQHNKKKYRFIEAADNEYLRLLDISTSEYQVRARNQDKFKQINKYVEIIHDILKRKELEDGARIVDMGSGKGYLTFALYDYFQKYRNQTPHIKGIEMRKDLVEKCNSISEKCGYTQLSFEENMIQDVNLTEVDMLIALHACDTATDDAIQKGIRGNAKIIICAPCCHKQVRKRLHTKNILQEITNHGILKERQAEIITDTIRAMIMEAYGYKTRVFEFISTSHTPKNVLIVGIQDEKRTEPNQEILAKVKELRELYGVVYHYLERIMLNSKA